MQSIFHDQTVIHQTKNKCLKLSFAKTFIANEILLHMHRDVNKIVMSMRAVNKTVMSKRDVNKTVMSMRYVNNTAMSMKDVNKTVRNSVNSASVACKIMKMRNKWKNSKRVYSLCIFEITLMSICLHILRFL